jgi:hypothetical protein
VREFDAPAILEVLRRHQVDHVVIGGMAAVAHGSPLLTGDIDVVPRNHRDNLERLSDALRELDAKIRNGDDDPLPFAHDATSLAGSVFWNLTTKHGDLDITFSPSGTDGYADLLRQAVTIRISGEPVVVAALVDVIRSKEAAGRDKDRRSLPILRELLAQQLRDKRP